jgi:hypothetical protein
MTIIPSDFLYLLIIDHIILLNRKESEELERCQSNDVLEPLSFTPLIMAFLGRSMSYQSATNFISIKDFQFQWISHVKEADLLFVILEKSTSILESVDNFINHMESLKSYFENTNQFSDNELSGPNKISPNSLLGVFIRKISAQWSILMFQQQCQLYGRISDYLHKSEQLNRFQCTSLTQQDIKKYLLSKNLSRPTATQRTSDPTDLKFIKNYPKDSNLFNYVQSTMNLLNEKNYSSAEDLIHNYFDGILNTSNQVMLFTPEATSIRNQQPAPETTNEQNSNRIANPTLLYTIEKNLRDLTQHEIMNNHPVLKHQHSMISLAVMWIHAKNYPLAQSAIEEAMKTSHQRGDHPTVIKCLLLLYEIYQKTSMSNTNTSSDSTNSNVIASTTNPDELLKRCIEKSGSLSLQDVFNESILKFLQYKISLISFKKDSPTTVAAVSDTAAYAEKIISQDWNISQLLNLLSFGGYNEPSLTLKYYTTKAVPHLDDPLGAVNPMVPNQQHQQQQQKALSNMEKLPLNGKYFQQTTKLTVLCNELYSRLLLHCSPLPSRSLLLLDSAPFSNPAEVVFHDSVRSSKVNHLVLTNYYRLLVNYGKFLPSELLPQVFMKFVSALMQELFDSLLQQEETLQEQTENEKIIAGLLISLYKMTEQFRKNFKTLNEINSLSGVASRGQNSLSDDRIKTVPLVYSPWDCNATFLLFSIALLKREYHQSILLLEKLLNMLEVPVGQISPLSQKTENDFNKNRFYNNTLSFEETVRIYLIYRIVVAKYNHMNFFVERQYLLKLCDYYKATHLLVDFLIVYLTKLTC